MKKRVCGCLLAGSLAAGVVMGATGGLRYDEALIPRFNIPRTATPPVIDGVIDADEWHTASKVMGMVSTGGLEFMDRPVSFWLAWDEQHLYLAYRVDILTTPEPNLLRAYRDKYATGVVHDDALEVGLFMHDRNKLEGEVPSFMKFVINSLGSGEYMKNYPSIGQVLFNWTPDFGIANRVYTDGDGRHWWEMEVAMDLDDLQMKVPHQAGDRIDIGLFADVKNPTWQWLDFPSASGHLEHYGFPRAILTENEPFIQVEAIGGLHDEKLDFRSVVRNPSDKAVKVDARLAVQQGRSIAGGTHTGAVADPQAVLIEKQLLEIPAGGSARFDVAGVFPGLPSAEGRASGTGFLQLGLTHAAREDAAPIYTFAANFWGTDKRYAEPVERLPSLPVRAAFNPANGRLALAADTLDAPVPEGAEVAGATYRVLLEDKEIAKGSMQYLNNHWYEDLVELGTLAPGKYGVELALVDADGATLASAERGFEKVNEAERFADWWQNDIGNTERLLEPFEPLRVKQSLLRGKTRIAVTRREYELGSLGLPRQIEANGGPVLSAPARIVVTVGGKEYAVPTDGKIMITGKEDWRVDFESAPVTVAGVRFSATGWMEQDGLVELALTYEPAGTAGSREGGTAGTDVSRKANLETAVPAVEIEALRIEWPVAQTTPDIYMACMGQGNNYSSHTIGAVAEGAGQVWNTRDDIGVTGSGRRAGNFVGNLWVGTEQRGLFWCADSDRGWEPHERVPALAVLREQADSTGTGPAVVMVNNLIGTADGKDALVLTEPRTVRFGYNASPFRHLADGWRLNQLSASHSFAHGKYKVNWDTGQELHHVLSPPFSDTARWAEYYAHCKDSAHKLTYEGYGWSLDPYPGASAYYSSFNRRVLYNANQIALRGYGWKSAESPNPYSTFMGDWMDSKNQETLSKTYTDYMIWLMDRQVKEGGCTHFYYDIAFGETLHSDPAAGFGYRLPDGSLQPESSDTNLREWHKRVFAMIQENDLYPGGVSGHATHSFSLKMLPFTDAILDSEFPMTDGIDVYPSEAMIALSCPHTFGVNVQHLQNFMNPTWPAMHDAASDGAPAEGNNGILGMPAFRHWGISRTDVEFVPYWRNADVVKVLTPGLIASIWRRPGSAVIAVMNYGPDAAGDIQVRAADLKLDLAALGIPAEVIQAGGDRLRIREFYNYPVEGKYLAHLAWARAFLEAEFPGGPISGRRKAMPAIKPSLDVATGRISGFDVNYHDVKYIALDWEEQPVEDGQWSDVVSESVARTALLDWGINEATLLGEAELATRVVADNPGLSVQVWTRKGDRTGRGNSVLMRVTNTGDEAVKGAIKLDLAGLGIDVRKVWSEFTSVVSLDGNIVGHNESADQRRGAAICFNAYDGEVYYSLAKGQSRVFALDRY